MPHDVVVFGGSAGSLTVLEALLAALPIKYLAPIIVVMHTSMVDQRGTAERLTRRHGRAVREAVDGLQIEPGAVYLAPANYHLLVEKQGVLALSVDARESFARPSIDVTMDSAGFALRSRAIGVLVSGGNADGARGLASIQHYGGRVFVQSPDEAQVAAMPQAGMAACPEAFVGGIKAIATALLQPKVTLRERL